MITAQALGRRSIIYISMNRNSKLLTHKTYLPWKADMYYGRNHTVKKDTSFDTMESEILEHGLHL